MTDVLAPTITLTPGAVCEAALSLVTAALSACGYDDLRRVHVAAGEVPWDDCCGQLTAQPERVYRSAVFPIEGPDEQNCYEGIMVVDVVVTLVRCVPVIDDRGNPPDVNELSAAYVDFLNQTAIVWNALAFEELPDGWERANQAQTFLGAEGGCVAVETRVTLGTDAEGWCPTCTT